MLAQACLMQAQGSENDGGDADRGTAQSIQNGANGYTMLSLDLNR